MIKSDNGLFYKVLSSVLAILILWFSAAVFDHSRVFEEEKTPFFCVSRKVRSDVEIYNGIGYTYTFITKNGRVERIWFENFLGANEYWVNCA